MAPQITGTNSSQRGFGVKFGRGVDDVCSMFPHKLNFREATLTDTNPNTYSVETRITYESTPECNHHGQTPRFPRVGTRSRSAHVAVSPPLRQDAPQHPHPAVTGRAERHESLPGTGPPAADGQSS